MNRASFEILQHMGQIQQIRCLYLFQMLKNGTAKIWKEVHKSRKNSADSLNDSVASNHSSLSSGYNRFHFNRPEEQNSKRSAVFQFTARNHHSPYDISVLTQRSHKKNASHISNNDVPVRDNPHLYQQPSPSQRLQQSALQILAKQLKFLTNSLRNTIEYFSKQIRQLKMDWDVSIKQLLKKQIDFDNTALLSLRTRLDDKQHEIQNLAQDGIATYRHSFTNRVTQNNSPPLQSPPSKAEDEGPLSRLVISKVQEIKTNEHETNLSRHNTLQSLLTYQSKATTLNGQRENKQLRTLRQTIKRMRDVLDPAH